MSRNFGPTAVLIEATLKPGFVESESGREMVGELRQLAARLDAGDRSAWSAFDDLQEGIHEANADWQAPAVEVSEQAADAEVQRMAERAAVRADDRKRSRMLPSVFDRAKRGTLPALRSER